MAVNFVLVLGVLLCSGAVLTAKGQDVREDIQRLLRVAEDIDENVEDLEDEIEDVGDEIGDLEDDINEIGDEIEDMEDEIEDFGEEIEDMKMDVEGVAAELVNLRKEVKTVRSVFETGQQDIGQRMAQLGEECSADSNCSHGLQKDIKEGLATMETAVEGLRGELEDKVYCLKEELQENHLVVKEELAKVEATAEKLGSSIATRLESLLANLTENQLKVRNELSSVYTHVETARTDLATKVDSLEEQLEEVNHLTVIIANHTEECLEDVKGEHVILRNDLGSKMDSVQEQLSEVSRYTMLTGNHTEKDLGDMKEELTDLRNEVQTEMSDLRSKVDSVERELHKVLANHTENHLEVKEELASLQRDMNSTLYILQEIKEQLINMRQEDSIAHQNNLTVGSCSEPRPTSQSGYYWLRGSPEKVYCDMDRQSCGCGNPWGWMRVANIDMTDPNQQCPEGFRLRPGTSKRMCEMTKSTGCTSIFFSSYNVQYRRVCGRVQAYQYGSPNAFQPYEMHRSRTIDDTYLEGVSISHGGSPRKHIWTFVAAIDETRVESACPCTISSAPYTGEVPTFIENDYFCDTGSREAWQHRLYIDDPLWDGEGCGPTSSCCLPSLVL